MDDEKYNSWVKITRKELKAYLGFCILMGINHLPALDDYWNKDPMYHYSLVADRDHFMQYLTLSALRRQCHPYSKRISRIVLVWKGATCD